MIYDNQRIFHLLLALNYSEATKYVGILSFQKSARVLHMGRTGTVFSISSEAFGLMPRVVRSEE